MKARIFIGSSLEAVSAADKVREHFQGRYDVIIWNRNVFMPGEGFLDSLLRTAELCNFGIFVFAPNDVITMRGTTEPVVRDNVLFECGMFFGKLGRHRSFFIASRDAKVHLPSDLAGIAPAYYVGGNRGIADACSAIEKRIKKEMHAHESVSLNGTWLQTWSVIGTTRFPKKNRAPAEVLHLGSRFLASCDYRLHPFWVIGTVEGGFITGTWGSKAEGLGYFGAFQVRMHPLGDRLEGVVVGFRQTGEIATGTWLWERPEPSEGPQLRRTPRDAIVTKPARRSSALKHLLSGISPKNVHAEVDWGKLKGREAW